MSRHQKRTQEARQIKQAKEVSKLYISIVLLAEKMFPGRHPEVRAYQASSTDRRVAVLLDPPPDAVPPGEVPEGHELKSNILEVAVTGDLASATKVLLRKMQKLSEKQAAA